MKSKCSYFLIPISSNTTKEKMKSHNKQYQSIIELKTEKHEKEYLVLAQKSIDNIKNLRDQIKACQESIAEKIQE